MNKFPETGITCTFINKYGDKVKAEKLSNLYAYMWLDIRDQINYAYDDNGVLCANSDTHSWIMYETELGDVNIFFAPHTRIIFDGLD